MKWNNLKLEMCPKCGAFLSKEYKYICKFCNFSIAFGKAYEIVGKKVDLERQATNLLKRVK